MMLTSIANISLGAFGKVYKGVYTKGAETFDIAVKTLRGMLTHVCSYVVTICNFTVASTSKTEQFIKECITAKLFNHPNVLGLIGVSYIKGEAVPLMILPFMQNGDVKSFMKAKRRNVLEVTEYPEVMIKLISAANYYIIATWLYSYIAI